MSTTKVKEFIVPVRPFAGVTVGKKYAVIERIDDKVFIINDRGYKDEWFICEGEFELVEEVDMPVAVNTYRIECTTQKPKREMKFSKKPGSAVVTYKTGETFHISRLTSMSVFQNEKDVLVDVTRTYTKDGLIFQERVGIPVHKFDKVVWVSPDDQNVEGTEFEITYDEKQGALVYNVQVLATEIDFT